MICGYHQACYAILMPFVNIKGLRIFFLYQNLDVLRSFLKNHNYKIFNLIFVKYFTM